MADKLLLFDIDGTLLLSRGIPRVSFLKVLKKHFPHISDKSSVKFSGMTDPQIIKQLLNANGDHTHIPPQLLKKLFKEFAIELDRNLNEDNPPDVLPGIINLLERLKSIPNCYLGLVTGNIMAGARIKLLAAGLYHYFPLGAFGSDHEDRNLLPPIAINRAQNFYNRPFKKSNIWIIGDSIYDIRCAKANNLKNIGLLTGFTPESALKNESPDFLLKNLDDTEKILSIIGFN